MPKCKNVDTGSYKGTEPSPKGLGICARGEAVGSLLEGLDGNMWEVKTTKNGTRRWVKIAASKSAKKKSAKKKSAKKKSAKKKSTKKKSTKKKSTKKKSAKKKSTKKKSTKKKSTKKKSEKKKSTKKKKKEFKYPTLVEQMKDNPWMGEILEKIANKETLTEYEEDLYKMMKSQPLPPGGITKLIKKYKKKTKTTKKSK